MMKIRLSAYWWCQIGGWGLFLLVATFFYFAVPRFTNFPSYSSLVVTVVLGVVSSHLMRLFIIKTKLLSLKIWKQFIYLFLTTMMFSFIYLVFASIAAALQGYRGYNPKESFLSNVSVALFVNFQFLVIWNLIYFAFHYIQKSRREEIAKIRLENELLVQKLENQITKAELKQQATELEMQALRAQMNPHFIFNSLNSINRFILQNNRTQASEYLTKFSKLVRMILQNSQTSLISLESELESLQLYLELEVLRFDDHFKFKLQVDNKLETDIIKVPPLIIQPYAENAIWHGLMHKEEKGQLDIEVSETNNHLFFKITDDGIGRKQSAALASKSATRHKSMGSKITAERIAMLQGSDSIESMVTINDLVSPEGNAAGTEVIIKIPVMYD
jgi:sensor histidine kinase YesM